MSMRIQTFETIIILREQIDEESARLWAEHFKECVLKPTPAAAIATEHIGRKKLAYPARGNQYGWYIIFRYRCTEDLINTKLDLQMRKDDMIIKFLTTNFKEDYIPDDLKDISEQRRQTPVDIFNLIFEIEDKDILKLYSISADGGESWTEQWLTEPEALAMAKRYNIKRAKE